MEEEASSVGSVPAPLVRSVAASSTGNNLLDSLDAQGAATQPEPSKQVCMIAPAAWDCWLQTEKDCGKAKGHAPSRPLHFMLA